MLKINDLSNYSKLLFIIAIILLAPLLVIPFYNKEIIYLRSFLVPSIFSLFLSFLFSLLDIKKYEKSNKESSSTLVLIIWLWGIIAGAMPFWLANKLDLVQSIFEAVSAFTTTGLSVIDVEKTSKIFLFHRSFMQFCGGLGFVMLMLILTTNKQSMDLYSAEGHSDKLVPNLKKTAQTIFGMYSFFLFFGTFLYYISGMTFFDSINHAMCSLSTGGFSTRLNSIGEYNSLSIQLVTIFLMIIGTTNFAVMLLFFKFKWRRFFRVSEVRFFLILLLITIPLVSLSLIYSLNLKTYDAFIYALFNLTSALSTTGYSTINYDIWPPFSLGIMILIMIIGGGMGSTAGGLKLNRVYLLVRFLEYTIKKQINSENKIQSQYYVKAQGKTKIDNKLYIEILGFIFVYLLILLIGALLISISEKENLTRSMFEFASSLSTVGLSIGITGPNTKNITLIIEIIGMILGRLEIFIVFIAIYTGVLKISKIKKIWDK